MMIRWAVLIIKRGRDVLAFGVMDTPEAVTNATTLACRRRHLRSCCSCQNRFELGRELSGVLALRAPEHVARAIYQ